MKKLLTPLLTTSLVVSGLVAPTATAVADEACTPSDVSITSGTLMWNIKDSLMDHIRNFQLASGTIATEPPAMLVSDQGPFSFPMQGGSATWLNTPGTELRFDGGASITAYPRLGPGGKPAMRNKLEDVRLRITAPGEGELIADYEAPERAGLSFSEPIRHDDAVFAHVRFDAPESGAKTSQNVVLKMTAAQGAGDFSLGRYGEGTELSPATLYIENSGNCLGKGEAAVPPQVVEGSSGMILPGIAIFTVIAGLLAGLYNWALTTGLIKLP